MQIPVLSLFTGGGFLDIGFEVAGFDIVWTNEIKPAFADMYEAAIAAWRAHYSSLRTTHTEIAERTSVTELTATRIIKKAFASLTPSFFGVIGGAPCQDFTASGKNEGITGDRGRLTQVFVDLISDIRPSFFVMENVPGLLRQNRHRIHLTRIIDQLSTGESGYLIDAKILNALEFGVPQDRERLFIIGFQKSIVPLLSYSRMLPGRMSTPLIFMGLTFGDEKEPEPDWARP